MTRTGAAHLALSPMAAAALSLAPASAQNLFDFKPSLSYAGHAGVRFASPDDDRARVDGGFGKFRFGGDGERDADAQIGEVALELDGRLNDVLGFVIHAQHQPEQRNAVDLVEAYLLADQPVGDRFSLRFKGGAFFPGLSKENRGVGWSNTYTITNNPASTWIAEDIRSFGATVGAGYQGDVFSATVDGGLFWGNDVSGPVLTFGGWALNDLKTPIFGDNRVPDLASGARPQNFDPFEELDDRIGFQARAEVNVYALGSVTAVYWDSRGDIGQSAPGAVVWDTRFVGAAGEFVLPFDVSFLPSFLYGRTATPTVDSDFYTISALFARSFGPISAAARVDYFGQDDKDAPFPLNLGEDGFALTAAARYLLDEHHEFLAEIIHQQTDRQSGPTPAPIDLQETQIQLGYRFVF